jgi:hypothetical protein
MKRQTIWKLWSLALGEKAHRKDQVADQVAIIRTIILITYMITNAFIVYGVIRTHIFPANQKPVKCILERGLK